MKHGWRTYLMRNELIELEAFESQRAIVRAMKKHASGEFARELDERKLVLSAKINRLRNRAAKRAAK